MKELNKYREILCSCIRRLIVVKMSVLPNSVNYMQSESKSQQVRYGISKLVLLFIGMMKGPEQSILKEKNKAGEQKPPISRLTRKLQ